MATTSDPHPADATAAPPAEAQVEARAEPPAPPTRPRSSTAAVVLATLAVGFTLWAAQTLLLPILLAMFFALIGNPILRVLQKLRIPRFIGALAVLSAGIASAVLMGSLLAAPAGDLMRQLPREMRQVAPKLREVIKPVQDARKGAENIARVAGGGDAAPVRVVRAEDDPYRALVATPRMAASVLAVVLLTFFFMIYGDDLQRKALALLPGRQQQRFTRDLLQSIEREVSRYVLTITIINAGLGLAFAGLLAALGLSLPEALMWGTLAAVLNFMPYVGPLVGVAMTLMMGFVHFDTPVQALLPAGGYLLLHALEGQLLTPIVLGRRMAISPLVLILGLMAFGWLWGVAGLLLAVPLLACVKLALERLHGMEPWARLME
ncbi:MAG TPA: AI-2E family transporter [Xanthomonadaceae bacterium]